MEAGKKGFCTSLRKDHGVCVTKDGAPVDIIARTVKTPDSRTRLEIRRGESDVSELVLSNEDEYFEVTNAITLKVLPYKRNNAVSLSFMIDDDCTKDYLKYN